MKFIQSLTLIPYNNKDGLPAHIDAEQEVLVVWDNGKVSMVQVWLLKKCLGVLFIAELPKIEAHTISALNWLTILDIMKSKPDEEIQFISNLSNTQIKLFEGHIFTWDDSAGWIMDRITLEEMDDTWRLADKAR